MLDEFQDVLKSKYPQLENCGGFDLLKCKPNSRNLPFMVTYPILHIQQLVSTGRIYIRPLQNDIIDLDVNEIDWVSSIFKKYCWGRLFMHGMSNKSVK